MIKNKSEIQEDRANRKWLGEDLEARHKKGREVEEHLQPERELKRRWEREG